MDTTKEHRRTEERRSFLFLTFVMAPAMTVVLVGGYGFVVWMYQLLAGPPTGSTTATRNATDTMMPSSVKNERSLFARICPRAMARTSVNRMRQGTSCVESPGCRRFL